ncbi:Por secretion system C-terminal sorting domain-containing protein [Polaribacter sp. KT25b]|uniref:T9SS type A sorting domain-containing protein n=1 Tax=Polaribacter sp. KT25b TaxID=1855336 RepID=UPI00087DD2C6|nr:T9SS type A sorting domain-containing protein [Polaribacter sp. KT25b]SDR70642.1 Por secretion system C-terminal sorting domain-containing protein [Polaribacter sp. KT25b]
MRKEILKKGLLLTIALFAFQINAQKFTFSTGLEGWSTNYGNNGTVEHAPTEGTANDGALKLIRATDNANFGIKPTPGVDASVKKYIKIKYKNSTTATVLRIGGKNDETTPIKTNSGGTIDINISPSLDEYVITYIDMSIYDLWKGELTDFSIAVRKNVANEASGSAFYLDEIEFLETAPAVTYSEFIQNPSFDGPSGITHISGVKDFASRVITSTEKHDGDQSLKTTFSTDASAPYWAFSDYVKTYTTKYPVDSDIQIKMWAKTNRTNPITISARVKLFDGGEETATKPIANVTTTNTNGEWEELTFDIKNVEEFDGIVFWFGINYVEGEATNLLAGDIVYLDQMTANITEATLKLDNNILDRVSIYPNPVVYGKLNINTVNGGEISLFNILGAKVLTSKAVTKNHSLDTSNLKSGVYLLNVVSNGKSYTQKIIIK